MPFLQVRSLCCLGKSALVGTQPERISLSSPDDSNPAPKLGEIVKSATT